MISYIKYNNKIDKIQTSDNLSQQKDKRKRVGEKQQQLNASRREAHLNHPSSHLTELPRPDRARVHPREPRRTGLPETRREPHPLDRIRAHVLESRDKLLLLLLARTELPQRSQASHVPREPSERHRHRLQANSSQHCADNRCGLDHCAEDLRSATSFCRHRYSRSIQPATHITPANRFSDRHVFIEASYTTSENASSSETATS